MDGLPVTIRLLDPPLHEFLPQEGPALERLCEQLATELNTDKSTVQRRLEGLHESNPMMGLRGCRLGTVHPEITEMQVGGRVGSGEGGGGVGLGVQGACRRERLAVTGMYLFAGVLQSTSSLVACADRHVLLVLTHRQLPPTTS